MITRVSAIALHYLKLHSYCNTYQNKTFILLQKFSYLFLSKELSH